MADRQQNRAVNLLRAAWFRASFAVVVGTGALAWGATSQNLASLRTVVTAALGGTLFIFGITVGLSTYLISNHVRGIRAAVLSQIATTRDRIWKAIDSFGKSDDPPVQLIIWTNLMHLAMLRETDWFEPNNHRGWMSELSDQLEQISDSKVRVELFCRYLQPIQEAVDELTVLFVRSIIAELHIEYITGIFKLLVVTVVVNVFAHVAPHSPVIDLFVVGLSASTIALAVLALLLAFAMVAREISNETEQFHEAEDAWSSSKEEDDDDSNDEPGAA